MSALLALHPTIRETLAAHEMFARLGINRRDLHVIVNPPDRDGRLSVLTQAQQYRRVFTFGTGEYERDIRALSAEWAAACDLWSGGSTDADVLALYEASGSRASADRVAAKMWRAGFRTAALAASVPQHDRAGLAVLA